MALSNTAARGAAITMAGQLVKFMVQVGSLVVLARLLTPADYGLITMVTAITGVALVLGDFGLSLAAIQARDLSQGQKSNLFWLNVSIGVASSVVVFACAGPIASFYGEPALRPVVHALAALFLLNGLTTQLRAELTRRMLFAKLATVEVASQAFGLAIAIAAALTGWGYWALVAQQISISAGALVGAAVLARWVPSWPSRGRRMGGLVKFGANTMGVQLITYVSNNVDSVVLGRVWGPAALGLYGRAFQLFTLPMQQLAAPLTRVALPVLSRIDDPSQYMRFLKRAQILLCYALIVGFGWSAALAVPGIEVVFGTQWAGAGPIFQLLALGGVFQAMSYVYYWVFLSKALTGIQLRYSLIGRSALVLLVLLGVPFGPLGVAGGYSAGMAALWMLYSTFGMRAARVGVAPLIASAVRPIVLAAAGFGVAQLAYALVSPHLQPWAVVVVQVLCLSVCAGLAFLLPAFRKDFRTVSVTARLVRGEND